MEGRRAIAVWGSRSVPMASIEDCSKRMLAAENRRSLRVSKNGSYNVRDALFLRRRNRMKPDANQGPTEHRIRNLTGPLPRTLACSNTT